jgi:N-glycosylase/DNA lyase
MSVDELREIHRRIRPEIERRLEEFRGVWRSGGDERIFAELVFCLLTPQSKAGVCWEAVKQLRRSGLLLRGSPGEIGRFLRPVRFWRKKAEFIVRARETFTVDGRLSIRHVLTPIVRNPFEARRYLADHVQGLGFKEASHFLRNVGQGEDLAILDRHILRGLEEFGVISAPAHLTPSRYIEVEKKMRDFSEKIGIPLSHLDFVLWYRKTGVVFK